MGRRRRKLFGLGVVVAWAVLIALPAPGGAQSVAPLPSASLDSAALAAWSDFPIQTSPRPLVLIDGDKVNAPVFGFPSDDAKAAFEGGEITPPPTFPAGPRRAAGRPLLSSRSAFLAMKDAALVGGSAATTPLNVTQTTYGTGVFQTDRGPRVLPAWLFTFQGIQNPAQVLAVAPSGIFTPRRAPVPDADPESSVPVGSVTLGRDHRTLTMEFGGAPAGTGPCDASYSLHTAASKTAVAVLVHQVVHYESGVGCLLKVSLIHMTTKLGKPLGNRVVVDADTSAAVPVTT